MIAEAHNEDSLVKFEELLEAAVDLDRIPDEYLISAEYDSGLQVNALPSTVPFGSGYDSCYVTRWSRSGNHKPYRVSKPCFTAGSVEGMLFQGTVLDFHLLKNDFPFGVHVSRDVL